MFRVERLKRMKSNSNFTNEQIARLSGVPISTVQKIFAGITKNPRADTLAALESVFIKDATSADFDFKDRAGVSLDFTTPNANNTMLIREEALAYSSAEQSSFREKSQGESTFRGKKQGEYTLEDYYALPEDGRYELIDGVIYDMAAPSFFHQIISSLIGFEFLQYKFQNGKSCWPVFAPFDIRLDKDDRTMVEPDLVVVCNVEGEEKKMRYYNGAPVFVLEVLSPSSRKRDLIIKLNKYWNAGVKEYWVIDPEEEQILVYDFESGRFPIVYGFHDKVPVGITGGELVIDFDDIMGKIVNG